MSMTRRRALIFAAIAAIAAPHGAQGYSEGIHALLDERALPAELAARPVAAPAAEDVDRLRRELWGVGATHPDGRVRERFLAAYPTVDAFDLWAMKDFLGFAADKPLLGFDAPVPAAARLGALLQAAARAPDDDRRNQDRFAHDAARQVRRDRFGQELPGDPAQLDISGRTGIPSQSYAHYGLPEVARSTDPDVLKREPRRWVPVATARAWGPDFAQLHTDLAICAATLGTRGGEALGWFYLGNAHHYLHDVANQIHTVIAIYEFFFDAKLEELKEELRSVGGLLRSRPDFKTIGVAMISNHHQLAEEVFAKRVAERLAGGEVHPAVADAIAVIAADDPELAGRLDARGLGPDDAFGAAIAAELTEVSSHEGAEVYRLIRALARPGLSRVGGHYESGMDPDAALRPRPDAAKLERFYRLQVAGFARAGTAVRRHVALYRAAVEPALADPAARRARFDASARRLVATQVAWLDARAERLAAYVPSPPRRERVSWWVPGGMLGLAAVFVGGPIWLVRRRRRRRRERDKGVALPPERAKPPAGK